MVDCRLKRNRNLASCKKGNPKNKLECWKKTREKSEYRKKDGTKIVQVVPLNGEYERQIGVSIQSPKGKDGYRNIIKEKYFGRFKFGPKEFREKQPSQKKANKFMEDYMRKHDKC